MPQKYGLLRRTFAYGFKSLVKVPSAFVLMSGLTLALNLPRLIPLLGTGEHEFPVILKYAWPPFFMVLLITSYGYVVILIRKKTPILGGQVSAERSFQEFRPLIYSCLRMALLLVLLYLIIQVPFSLVLVGSVLTHLGSALLAVCLLTVISIALASAVLGPILLGYNLVLLEGSKQILPGISRAFSLIRGRYWYPLSTIAIIQVLVLALSIVIAMVGGLILGSDQIVSRTTDQLVDITLWIFYSFLAGAAIVFTAGCFNMVHHALTEVSETVKPSEVTKQ